MQELIRRSIDLWQRARRDGSPVRRGLGLVIVRQVVEPSGGH